MSSTVFVNAVSLTQALWFQDVDNVAYQYLSGVAGTNTITAVGPSGLGAYAAGLKFRLLPANTNTGATTINITGTAALGARNVFYNGAACLGGELRVGVPVEITDDGTQFNITSFSTPQGSFTPSLGGSATYTGTPTGTYMKVGKMAFVNINLVVNILGTGSTTTISGLPFSIVENTIFSVRVTLSATAVVSIFGFGGSGGTSIQLLSRVAANVSDGANAIFANSTSVTVTGCYPV